jgi:hypothetical protein
MAQIFHPSTNLIAKASLFGAVFLVAGAAWMGDRIQRSPYVTEQRVARDQPVPFSHKHHVQGLGIDCRYCHTTVEDAAFAGIPPTKTCMTCHTQLFTDAVMLEPVRESWRTNRSVEWIRVHDLPDFAYFDHSIHVAKGVGCSTCHGRVDRMPLVWRESPLDMQWCIACHRAPEAHLRPKDRVFDMEWTTPVPRAELPPELVERYAFESDPVPQSELGPALVDAYGVVTGQLTDCSVCHR